MSDVLRFKGSLVNGSWQDNPEPLVRSDTGNFCLYSDYEKLQEESAALRSQLFEVNWLLTTASSEENNTKLFDDLVEVLERGATKLTGFISVNKGLPTKTMKVVVRCHDLVSSWEQEVEAYICPEYGNLLWQADGEDFSPIITHWKPKETSQ